MTKYGSFLAVLVLLMVAGAARRMSIHGEAPAGVICFLFGIGAGILTRKKLVR